MNRRRIGVYICHCGSNIAGTVDVKDVRAYAESLPNVIIARDYPYLCSEQGQELIKKDIKDLKLDAVVVAACSPRMHEHTFRRAIRDAGMNPYCYEQANIREQCSWVHTKGATAKAKEIVRAAVFRVALLEPLEEKEVSVLPSALVLGGGIAGIQAALDIANAGFKVYLVEKSPSIGGHMAQLDKTFPTLDCAACILTPKMSEIEHHENIELLTYSEVESVEGFVGNFKVKVRRKARFVDEEKCTGCGLCAEACRLSGKIPDEFNAGMKKRSAIYIPFPQAVPSVYVVDADNCLMITKGKCGKRPKCVEVCPADAIDFSQNDEIIEISVGTIIVATGFDVYKPHDYGYGKFEEVITSLELERLMNASGPTGGRIIVNGREPKRVVFISCVGSRSEERPYCSRICCMYIMKQAHLIKEKIPDADITVLYTDVRAYGKGYEEFYQRVRAEVNYVRRELDEPIEVFREGENGVVVRAVCEGVATELRADLVVLATAVIPRGDAARLARMLKLGRKSSGFFLEAHPKLRPVETLTEGIFIAGCCQSPKDIQDTVAQASAAASAALKLLFAGKCGIEATTAVLDERKCISCGLCVASCPFGAISLADKRIEEVLCKGCGSCAATCPTGAIEALHFKNEQIAVQIKNLI
ncbi:MAG: CoB--CoM heterodisulfide reductase iron-sulfur subunit A family protein [Candidatus Methanospirare jalkutatii]|nr:MAG: CoB--CoM heterodisulfide reductase iron-sulfur subunit A family protein [Candidatus Methanospirare jalkutatii]